MARVLVVDDAALARRILKNVLETAGHEIVGEASNGEAAIAAYRRHHPDLVMMDVTMPEMDGVEASRRILSEFPDATLVMVTSVSRERVVRDLARAGVADFIVKPYRPDTVLKAVARVLSPPL